MMSITMLPVIYKGTKYKNFSEGCRELNVNISTVRKKVVEKGVTFEEAVDMVDAYRAGVEYKGVTYKSKNMLCKELGITIGRLRLRLELGMDLEKAVDHVLSNKPLPTNNHAKRKKRLENEYKPPTKEEIMMMSGVWSDELPSRLAMITNGRST